MALEKYLSATQVAEIIGASTNHTRQMIRDGDIPASRLGGRKRGFLRVKESDLTEYIESRKLDIPTELAGLERKFLSLIQAIEEKGDGLKCRGELMKPEVRKKLLSDLRQILEVLGEGRGDE